MQHQKKYLSTRRLCDRYDRKDRGWVWHELRRNPDFPRPALYLNGRPLWDADKQDEYDEKLRREASDARTSIAEVAA
jgi:hypothetical protein